MKVKKYSKPSKLLYVLRFSILHPRPIHPTVTILLLSVAWAFRINNKCGTITACGTSVTSPVCVCRRYSELRCAESGVA